MSQELTLKRKILFSAVSLCAVTIFLFLVVETAAYYIMTVKGVNFYLPLELNDRENIPEAGPATTEYYFELGWEPVYPNDHGYRGEARDTSNAAVAVFGDSYTKAHPEYEKSWPYLLEQKLGRPVLNFGVSGYGTDQAYLRFEKRYANKIRAPYVVLLIMSENIARTVNVYRGFYKRLRKMRPTKPRFILNEDGVIELLPNPIMARDELKKLWDIDFLKEIGKNDYWYQYFDKYNLNQFVGFPYSYYFLKASPYYLERGYKNRMQNRRIYDDLYENIEATEILRQVSLRFVARAEQTGSTPLIVFLPNWKDMTDYQERGATIYGEFYEKFRREQHAFTYDAMENFAAELNKGKLVSDFFLSRNDGHYNDVGESVVADALFEILVTLDVKHGQSDVIQSSLLTSSVN